MCLLLHPCNWVKSLSLHLDEQGFSFHNWSLKNQICHSEAASLKSKRLLNLCQLSLTKQAEGPESLLLSFFHHLWQTAWFSCSQTWTSLCSTWSVERHFFQNNFSLLEPTGNLGVTCTFLSRIAQDLPVQVPTRKRNYGNRVSFSVEGATHQMGPKDLEIWIRQSQRKGGHCLRTWE